MLDSLFQQGWGLNTPAMVARSDMFLGAVYLAVPVGLASLVRQRRDLRFGWVFWLFTLFAVACGTTHVMDALVWRHPDPAILAAVKALSAALSALMITVLWARL